MIDKLYYYCHNILPLVYDDSLSYYEVVCKVVQKLNEVIEVTNAYDPNTIYNDVDRVLHAMLQNGEFSNILSKLLLSSNTISNAYLMPFAQMGYGYTNGSVEVGLQTGTIYNDDCITIFQPRETYNAAYILAYNLNNGTKLFEKTLPYDAHINGVCVYNDKLLIANSSGANANTIYICDYPSCENGELKKVNFEITGITTDGTTLWCFTRDNKIVEVDSINFVVLNEYPLSYGGNAIIQGFMWSDGIFYLSMSQWINGNQLSAFCKVHLDKDKAIIDNEYIIVGSYEIEAMSFWHNALYGFYRTTGYCSLNKIQYKPEFNMPYTLYTNLNPAFLRRAETQSVYISDKAGFFCDGSITAPFAIINLATDFIYPNFNQTILHIIGDHHDETLTLIDANSRVYCSFENAAIKGINISRCKNVVINGNYINTGSTLNVTDVNVEYTNKVNILHTISTGILTSKDSSLTFDDVKLKKANFYDSKVAWKQLPTNSVYNYSNTTICIYGAIGNDNITTLINSNYIDGGKIIKDLSFNNYAGNIDTLLTPCRGYFNSSCSLTNVPVGMESGVTMETKLLNSTGTYLQTLTSGTTKEPFKYYMRVIAKTKQGPWIELAV